METINKDLLFDLATELLEDALREPWIESISTALGETRIQGITYQMQISLTQNEDDFLPVAVDEDVFS